MRRVITQILVDDQNAPVKQRRTAKRIFKQLRNEHGFDSFESHVRRYVAGVGHRHREVSIPLAQQPSEARFNLMKRWSTLPASE
jgi:hypothetical protein